MGVIGLGIWSQCVIPSQTCASACIFSYCFHSHLRIYLSLSLSPVLDVGSRPGFLSSNLILFCYTSLYHRYHPILEYRVRPSCPRGSSTLPIVEDQSRDNSALRSFTSQNTNRHCALKRTRTTEQSLLPNCKMKAGPDHKKSLWSG